MYIIWVLGTCHWKGDFSNFGTRNCINFDDFVIKNEKIGNFFKNWHKVRYTFLKLGIRIGYIF